MRKGVAFLLLLTMLTWMTGALADASPVMAGYDGDGSNHVWETNLFFQRMEERTGISFTFNQSTDYDKWTEAKKNMFASGDLPDVLFKAELTPEETEQYYAAGQLIDLKPYLEQYAPNLSALLKEHPEWEKAITLPDGAIVALPTINQLQNNNAIWINRTWLDNLGLSVPTTADELTEVLRAFKTGDPNKNGKKDEIPLTFMGMWDLKFFGHAFGVIANDYNIYLDEDGVVKTSLDQAGNRSLLEWLHGLWTEGLLDQSGFTTSDSFRQITDSDATITYGVIMGTTPLSLVPSSAMGQYELLMPLAFDGTQAYRDLLGDVVRGTFAVTSACEDPAAMVSWVDYLYSEEGCRLMQAGLEGEEYTVNADGTWDWIDSAESVANTVLANATISEGGNTPGLCSVTFQMTYDNADTHRIITSLKALKDVSRMPYPIVYLTQEDQAKVDAIQSDLGAYAEKAMIHFVTGDETLDDDSWNAFCQTVHDKGMDDMLVIWQAAVR